MGAVPLAVPPPAPNPSSSKSRAGRNKKKQVEDPNAGWTTVLSAKEKRNLRTWEERKASQQAHKDRITQQILSTESEAYTRTLASMSSSKLFSPVECDEIEALIDQVVLDARRGLFKKYTVDLTPMRNKYFFGFAYTYGAQKEHPGSHGLEAVHPPEETEEIPTWIRTKIIDRLEAQRVVKKNWINAVTINDYSPGGCIVSHIDPPHLFDRPIVTTSFFSDCNLVFGTVFSYPKDAQNIVSSTPVLVHACLRGHLNKLSGYSANNITHAIRPCDLPSRRASIILRRVLPTAPVLVNGTTVSVEQHMINLKK